MSETVGELIHVQTAEASGFFASAGYPALVSLFFIASAACQLHNCSMQSFPLLSISAVSLQAISTPASEIVRFCLFVIAAVSPAAKSPSKTAGPRQVSYKNNSFIYAFIKTNASVDSELI